MEKKALSYLEKDKLLHVGMIFPIKRKTAKIIYAEEDGVLLKELKSDAFMLSVDDFNLGKKLLDLVTEGNLFNAHQDFMVDYILEKFKLTKTLECFQAVYLKKEPLPIDNNGFTIKKLELEHLEMAFKHYNDNVDFDYLKERILDGELYGGFKDEELCGFIGSHEEGGIGILEILPEYRKKGLGFALESFMINLFLKQGQIPFGQVTINNEKSLNLQRKLGMEISKNKVYWLF